MDMDSDTSVSELFHYLSDDTMETSDKEENAAAAPEIEFVFKRLKIEKS